MTDIHIHASSPVIFVDGSYYVFHRYFATHRFYSIRNFEGLSKEEQLEITQTLHENEEFMTAFFKHVKQDVKKWQKMWKVPHGNIIFGFDCVRGDIWRHAYHDGYKQTRTASQTFNGNIFPQFYRWFDEHKEECGLECIEYDSLEADDVIYLGVDKINQIQPDTQITVMTNDNDYLQLCSGANNNVKLINAQFKDIAERSSVGDADQDLLIKILMGDTSDNIPPVAPKIGPVTAKKLAAQGREYVEDWAQKKGCYERYKENERLISFKCIPSDLVEAFKSKYNWVLV